MKRTFSLFLFLLFSFYACKNNDRKESAASENDIDAARNFIRAALDGSFEKARNFMVEDSSNNQYLDAVERNYRKMPPDTINQYRGASITIHTVQPVNDSATVVIFSNSFKNDHDTLRVLKINGQWLIDLKYLFEHDREVKTITVNQTDSVK